MMPHDPRDLPPEMRAAIESAQRYNDLVSDMHARERREVVRLAAILCSCDPRYSPGQPPNAGCMVHGGFMITPAGDIL